MSGGRGSGVARVIVGIFCARTRDIGSVRVFRIMPWDRTAGPLLDVLRASSILVSSQ